MGQKHPLGGKRRSGVRKTKKDYVIQKANILSFQGLTALFAVQQELFLHHATVFYGKGPLPFSP